MLDLLLAAEYNGLIDYDGIKEEVDTFTFEVSKIYVLYIEGAAFIYVNFGCRPMIRREWQ